MPENWKTFRLGDLIEINAHSINRDFIFEEIEYIDTSSITENKIAEIQRLKTTDAPSRAKRLVKNNDIIYSTVRPIQRHYGFIKEAKPNTVVSTGFAVLTPKKIEPKFLYYYLSRDEIVGFLNGVAESNTTTFPAFNASLFDRLEIEIPESIEEQRRISDILSVLDEKIELNLQMNATLDKIAQATFKQWFVDFRFPDFDGELVDGLPKGWRKVKLERLIEIKHGFAFAGEFFSDLENENILLTPGNFKIGGGFNEAKFKYYTGEVPESYVLKHNDLIVTMTDLSRNGDTLGYPALVPQIRSKRLLHNQRLGKVLFKVDFPIKFYLYWVMRQFSYKNFVLGSATGSTVRHTSPKRICDYEVILPNENILIKFDGFAKELISKEQENLTQNQTLNQIRDGLLPKLMSGKIRVAE